jgi:hypothetical protein
VVTLIIILILDVMWSSIAIKALEESAASIIW